MKFDWCLTVAPYYFFSTKILSEDPYLKSFIRRVLCSHRERFCSSQASVIRLHAAPYFLPALHSAAGTKAVNAFFKFLYCNRLWALFPGTLKTLKRRFFSVYKYKKILILYYNNYNRYTMLWTQVIVTSMVPSTMIISKHNPHQNYNTAKTPKQTHNNVKSWPSNQLLDKNIAIISIPWARNNTTQARHK